MLAALFTFGIFREPAEHPANDGFHLRNDPILSAVEESDGFVARSGYDGEPGPASWGTQVYPEFYVERGDGWSPETLSLWEDLESIAAFSYHGLHAEALRLGRNWMVTPEWPPYVLWWVAPDQRPEWPTATTGKTGREHSEHTVVSTANSRSLHPGRSRSDHSINWFGGLIILSTTSNN